MSGFSVRSGESFGMSQRFGSVVSYVRIGDWVLSPLFPPGEAHYLLGLELVEVLRNVHYASPETVVVVDPLLKPPLSSSLGYAERVRRTELLEKLRSLVPRVIEVPAQKIAEEAGSRKAANIVLFGVLNAVADLFSDSVAEKAIMYVLAGRRWGASVRAYRLGKKFALKRGLHKL